MLSHDLNFPFVRDCVSIAIGKTAPQALSAFLSVSLTFFVKSLFQGSEWNAANFEELQKNKLVFVLASNCPYRSV